MHICMEKVVENCCRRSFPEDFCLEIFFNQTWKAGVGFTSCVVLERKDIVSSLFSIGLNVGIQFLVNTHILQTFEYFKSLNLQWLFHGVTRHIANSSVAVRRAWGIRFLGGLASRGSQQQQHSLYQKLWITGVLEAEWKHRIVSHCPKLRKLCSMPKRKSWTTFPLMGCPFSILRISFERV